jgi:hypothetical protein
MPMAALTSCRFNHASSSRGRCGSQRMSSRTRSRNSCASSLFACSCRSLPPPMVVATEQRIPRHESRSPHHMPSRR